MIRPFATFSELILAIFVTLCCALPTFFVIKKMYYFAFKSEKKCYYTMVLSTFFALVLLYLSSLDFSFFELKKFFLLLHFALGICAFCFAILVIILIKRLLIFSQKEMK